MKPNSFIGVWVVMSILFLSSCSCDPPRESAQNFLNALYLEDFDQARDLSTDGSADFIETLELMNQGAKKSMLDLRKGDPPKVIECRIKNGIATCQYCCGMEEQLAAISLIRMQSEWKVDLTQKPDYPFEMDDTVNELAHQ